MNKKIKIVSTIRCKTCGHKEKIQMPLYAAKTYYSCSSCGQVHGVLKGNCCVFCSYGTTPCPSAQARSQRNSLVDLRLLEIVQSGELR